MAKVKCPVKETEINTPQECPQECMYLSEGECVHPLMGMEQGGSLGIC